MSTEDRLPSVIAGSVTSRRNERCHGSPTPGRGSSTTQAGALRPSVTTSVGRAPLRSKEIPSCLGSAVKTSSASRVPGAESEPAPSAGEASPSRERRILSIVTAPVGSLATRKNRW